MKVSKKAKSEATTVTLSYRETSDSFRREMKEKGVALMQSGSYVGSHLEKGALEASVLEAGADKKTVIFDGKNGWANVKSNQGNLLRRVELSECGQWGRFKGKDGKKGILRLDIFGDKGSIEFLTEAQLLEVLRTAESMNYTRQKDGYQFAGKRVGDLSTRMCALVTVAGGELVAIDCEFRKNEYNGETRGACGGANKSQAEKVEALLSGGGTVKAKKVKKKGEATK